MLPINFDTLYEVHLFTVLPVLAAWLLLLAGPRPWLRGSAVALLGLAAVLVRNELAVAFGLVAVLCLVLEARAARRGGPTLLGRLPAYALPSALVAALCVGACWRSTVPYRELRAAFADKHQVNMAQVFSFGYQQRHPEWTRSPWVEYQALMRAHFGKETPSLREMCRRNPRAVLEHFAWNTRLTPAGLEVLLFNATAEARNPDYPPPRLNYAPVRRLSLLALAVLACAAVLGACQWRYWWEHWFRGRAVGWLAMAAFLPVSVLIILSQRPRPSYLFTLSLFLMAAVGTAVHVLLSQWPAVRRRLAALAPLAMIALCCLVRPFYAAPAYGRPQPCRAAVARMLPFRELIARPGVTLLHGNYTAEVGLYVGQRLPRYLGYDVLGGWQRGEPLEAFLAREKVDLFCIDESLLRTWEQEQPPGARSFLTPEGPAGWKLVGGGDTPGDRWRLFQRL